MKKVLLLSAMVMGLALTSCESDGDSPITYSNVTVNVGDTYTVPNSDGCDWQSGNPVVASVAGDLVSTHYVGSAKIWCAKGNFVVTVDPITTLYIDPITQWGATVKNVKDQLTDGWQIKAETETTLTYNPNTQAADQLCSSYVYTFEPTVDEKGKASTALIYVKVALPASVELETINAALTERYISAGENSYKSTDGTMTVTLTTEDNGSYTITYAPAEA